MYTSVSLPRAEPGFDVFDPRHKDQAQEESRFRSSTCPAHFSSYAILSLWHSRYMCLGLAMMSRLEYLTDE